MNFYCRPAECEIIDSKWKLVSLAAIFFMSVLFVYILFPLADGIVLGLVFAYIARPIFLKMKRFRKTAALLATMFIVVPVVFIIGSGIVEILRQVIWIIENQADVINTTFDLFRSIDIPEKYGVDVQQMVWNISSSFFPLLSKLGILAYAQNLVMFALNLLVAIFLCYFLLADGKSLYNSVLRVVPSEHKSTVTRYLFHLDVILQGVFIGNASAGLIASILSIIVFYAFGFSHILALSTLIFIASVVPLFAGYMVLLALCVHRYLALGLESAIMFFVVSSIVIYAPPELFLRPYISSIKSQVHPFLLFLSFLGGAFVGGIAGFFIAPIVLGSIIAAYRVHTGYGEPGPIQEDTPVCEKKLAD
ncbi:MAG: AI-2E family transporter [Methanolobus sp.]|nr:AI-2E family transporter [Methanolobus sp.]